MKKTTIYDAKIVTPDAIILNGAITIADGKIVAIERGTPLQQADNTINANGSWVFPGFIDTHSDAIELELQPRPSSTFPMEVSFFELEKKLVGEGITTIYHSLSLLDENAKKLTRKNETVFSVLKDIKKLASGQHLIRHKTHLRYEITNTSAVAEVESLLIDNMIDQLSFMDHTPGQGQFRNIEFHKKFLISHRHYSEQEATQVLEESKKLLKLDPELIQRLANIAVAKGIPVASHDDDSLEKLKVVTEWNATISEFPIELEVAKKAKELGLYVVMGAPNALLGKSHSNNLSALEALRHGVVDIFCSDYYPSSLLHTVFKLYYQNLPMNQAVNMVTLNPAKALKINDDLGSIEEGKKADLLIISEAERRPVLETVFVNGTVVCQMNYQEPTLANHSLIPQVN